MAKREFVDQVVMIMTFLIGCVLFVTSANAFPNIPADCDENIVMDGMTVILCISVMLIVIPLSYYFCTNSHNCYQTDTADRSDLYIYLVLALGIIIAILSASIGSKIKGKCSDSKLKFKTWFIFSISIIMLIYGSGSLYYMNYVIPGQVMDIVK